MSIFYDSSRMTIFTPQYSYNNDIDFSFALCPTKRRQNLLSCMNKCRRYSERTSFYQENDLDTSDDSSESASSHLSNYSCRSVTFAKNIVSEVKYVTRYDKDKIGELFYSQMDVSRFKREMRMEKMRLS